MKIKNKKAMLLASQVLKIVLAVIGIAILAYLLFALYNAGVDSEDLKDANSAIERISKIIIELKANPAYVENITDMTPNGWSIFSFVGSETKPNVCAGKDCLCICDEVYGLWGLLGDRQQKECDEEGVCLVVVDLQKFAEIPIEGKNGVFTKIEVKKIGKWIGVTKL